MSWRSLLAQGEEQQVLPWVGDRRVYRGARSWKIQGRRPREHGWYTWKLSGRTVELVGEAEGPDPAFEDEHEALRGYLAGSRFVADDARVDPDPAKLVDQTEQVYCVERGLERFTRAVVVRTGDDKLIYVRMEFPEGPELEVQMAFQDRLGSVSHVRDVTPALDLAFRWETYQREQAEERERERERVEAEEAARLEAEERLRQAMKNVGTGAGRRALAQRDFAAAARAALAISGAELLDHREGAHRAEMVVNYRFRGRRFQCVCHRDTLRIIDAGVCLDDHRGEKGDTYFTLESLPPVIGQAMDERRLVVWRHLDGRPNDGYEWDEERW
jgi:hypothetical protein